MKLTLDEIKTLKRYVAEEDEEIIKTKNKVSAAVRERLKRLHELEEERFLREVLRDGWEDNESRSCTETTLLRAKNR